jgi:hypothetical protein
MRVLSQVRFQFMDAPQQLLRATPLTAQLGFEASQACGERANLLGLCLNGQLLLGGLRHRTEDRWVQRVLQKAHQCAKALQVTANVK